MKSRLLLAALLLGLVGVGIATKATATISKDSRLFELRLYTASPGRLDALDARFRDHANRLFAKHKMTVIAYWISPEKPDTYAYMLAFKDKAERDAKWAEFIADPEWTKAQKDSEADGVRLIGKSEVIAFSATDYSPLK